MTRSARQDGFALPATMLALVVIGALVTGGLYTAMQNDRGSANAQLGNYAFLAAERGLEDVMGYRTRVYFEDSVGAPGTVDVIGPVPITVEGLSAQYTLKVKRLNQLMFMVESEGEVTSGGRYAGTRRRLAEVMRIGFTSLPMDRAVTSHVGLRMRGLSGIQGMDAIPSGWSDCSSVGEQTGVVTTPGADIDVLGAASAGLRGDPPSREDATLDSLSFIEYGDMHLEDLMDMAQVSLPGGTYTGMEPNTDPGYCDKDDQMNWGAPDDPTNDCHLYWPIVHSDGDLHLSSGVGQGILIVEGDLVLTGDFEFKGLVFVYGSLRASGTGNKVLGSTNILGSSPYETEIGTTGAGSTNLQLSSCAIERAHRYNERFARPIPLKERKFLDISGLGIE
jgi:hypothetical protein